MLQRYMDRLPRCDKLVLRRISPPSKRRKLNHCEFGWESLEEEGMIESGDEDEPMEDRYAQCRLCGRIDTHTCNVVTTKCMHDYVKTYVVERDIILQTANSSMTNHCFRCYVDVAGASERFNRHVTQRWVATVYLVLGKKIPLELIRIMIEDYCQVRGGFCRVCPPVQSHLYVE